jgi:DNA-binding transcriptional MerR regulator
MSASDSVTSQSLRHLPLPKMSKQPNEIDTLLIQSIGKMRQEFQSSISTLSERIQTLEAQHPSAPPLPPPDSDFPTMVEILNTQGEMIAKIHQRLDAPEADTRTAEEGEAGLYSQLEDLKQTFQRLLQEVDARIDTLFRLEEAATKRMNALETLCEQIAQALKRRLSEDTPAQTGNPRKPRTGKPTTSPKS